MSTRHTRAEVTGFQATGLCVFAFALLLSPSAGRAQPPERVAVASTPYFAFFSDFATNLNDALIAAGAARRSKQLELFSAGQSSCFDELPPAERAAWNHAVDYYAEIISAVQYDRREQLFVRLWLAGILRTSDLTNTDDRRFLEVSDHFRAAAAPAYERCRWPAQDAANRAWIADVSARLAIHETAIAARLPRVFQAEWRGIPYPVDVVQTVSAFGNNSVNLTPPGLHIMASSAYSAGAASLEVVFHEASHYLTGAGMPLPEALQSALRSSRKSFRGDLTHVVHFYLAGHVVRRQLADAGEPAYTPLMYADNLVPRLWDALERSWAPYLDERRTLAEAATDLMHDVP